MFLEEGSAATLKGTVSVDWHFHLVLGFDDGAYSSGRLLWGRRVARCLYVGGTDDFSSMTVEVTRTIYSSSQHLSPLHCPLFPPQSSGGRLLSQDEEAALMMTVEDWRFLQGAGAQLQVAMRRDPTNEEWAATVMTSVS